MICKEGNNRQQLQHLLPPKTLAMGPFYSRHPRLNGNSGPFGRPAPETKVDTAPPMSFSLATYRIAVAVAVAFKDLRVCHLKPMSPSF